MKVSEMKTAPAWIHTGLNVHPRLAYFLKKWGFSRESVETETWDQSGDWNNSLGNVSFWAIIKGVSFQATFWTAQPNRILIHKSGGKPFLYVKPYSRGKVIARFINSQVKG